MHMYEQSSVLEKINDFYQPPKIQNYISVCDIILQKHLVGFNNWNIFRKILHKKYVFPWTILHIMQVKGILQENTFQGRFQAICKIQPTITLTCTNNQAISVSCMYYNIHSYLNIYSAAEL